jgi:hypothetical protein
MFIPKRRNLMKAKYQILLTIAALASASTLSAKDKVCHHCEEIREYNAAHHHDYEYFDDYAKSDDFGKDDDNPFLTKDETKPASKTTTLDKGKPVAERSK